MHQDIRFYDDDQDIKKSMQISFVSPNVQHPNEFTDFEMDDFPSPSAEFPNELLDQLINDIPITSAACELRSDPFLTEAQSSIKLEPASGETERSTVDEDHNYGLLEGGGSDFISGLTAVGSTKEEILRYLKDESDAFATAASSPSPAVVPTQEGTTVKLLKTPAKRGPKRQQPARPLKGKRKRTSSSESSTPGKARSYSWGECMTHQAIKARQRRLIHKQEMQQLRNQISSYERQFSTMRNELDHMQKLVNDSDELRGLIEQLSLIPEANIQALIARFINGRSRKRLRQEAGLKQGICLHVQNGKLSVEFCGECDRRSQSVGTARDNL